MSRSTAAEAAALPPLKAFARSGLQPSAVLYSMLLLLRLCACSTASAQDQQAASQLAQHCTACPLHDHVSSRHLTSALLVLQLRELELKLKQYGNSEMTTNPQDFISRKDHARLIDARINGREADLQVCFTSSACVSSAVQSVHAPHHPQPI